LTAYQPHVATPEVLASGKSDIRRSFIAYWYFVPYKSLEEKMALVFVLAEANNDGFLSRENLTEASIIFLGTAVIFQP
jgi:hypothetical protein